MGPLRVEREERRSQEILVERTHHFPMQNCEKTESRIASSLSAAMTSVTASSAARRSSATYSRECFSARVASARSQRFACAPQTIAMTCVNRDRAFRFQMLCSNLRENLFVEAGEAVVRHAGNAEGVARFPICVLR